MTKKELAEKLNGTEYDGFRIFSQKILQEAKESGLVIVYGVSDDSRERLRMREVAFVAVSCILILTAFPRTRKRKAIPFMPSGARTWMRKETRRHGVMRQIFLMRHSRSGRTEIFSALDLYFRLRISSDMQQRQQAMTMINGKIVAT